MSIGWVGVVAFAAECACYVAVGMLGWRVHPVVGIAAVLVMALWWAMFHSPKAAVGLAAGWDVTLRIAWFLTGAAAALALGRDAVN